MSVHAIVVAAGRGVRAGADLPKQWRPLAGRPVLRWSVEAFFAAGVDQVVVVTAAGDEARVRAALAGLPEVDIAPGGETRRGSVEAGLSVVSGGPGDFVLIHDAARPFLTKDHVDRLTAALADAPGAVPALAVADTLKRPEGAVLETVPREGLWRAQTPQAFRLGEIRTAFAALPAGADHLPTTPRCWNWPGDPWPWSPATRCS